MSTVVDLSNNNPRVSMVRLRLSRVSAVYHKASEGRTFVDPYFAARRQTARRIGLPFGAYHFAHPGVHSARDEAEHFCKVVGRLTHGELRPALDLELNERHLSGRELVDWARAFNHAVVGVLGVWPIFYSYSAFIESMRAERPIGAGLWLASFGPNDGREHPYRVPSPWHHCILHQYTSTGRRAGVSGHVDLSSCASLRPLRANKPH